MSRTLGGGGGVVRKVCGLIRIVDCVSFVEKIRKQSITVHIRGSVVPYCVFTVEVAGEDYCVL